MGHRGFQADRDDPVQRPPPRGPNTYLYALSQRNDASVPFTANALRVLRVNRDGTLTEVATSPTVLPVPQDGTRPLGVLAP